MIDLGTCPLRALRHEQYMPLLPVKVLGECHNSAILYPNVRDRYTVDQHFKNIIYIMCSQEILGEYLLSLVGT